MTFENGKALGHNYSEFKVTKEPTCTETGTADSICSVCGDTQHNTLAALGHKYTNQYEQISYEYGDYGEIYQHAPKCDVCGYVNESAAKNHKYDNEHFHVTSGDVVYKVCNVCGYYDDMNPVGSLSDWTVKESVAADYNQAGYTIYTKDTYEYRKEFAKLVAPYDGKTYYSYNFHINDNGVFAIETAWSSAQITFNENGVGTGKAHPFRGTTTITMRNAETGEINWESGTSNFKGYVNFETGVIIRSESGETFDRVFMMIPVDRGVTSSDILGSDLGDGMAVTFTAQCDLHERHTSNFAISDEKVFFDVNFEGKEGNALTVDNIANSDYVKVCAKDGTVLVAYQKNANGVFQETDGKEGTYNDATYGDVVLNGIGGATIGESTGVYSYNADKACYELYVGTSQADATAYYTFTLTDGAIALTKPMTTITYVTAYGADTIDDAYKSVNNNIKLVLPTFEGVTETEGNVFVGWTVEGQEGYVTEYTPTGADVTFTAVWRAPLTITIKDGAAGETITKQVPYGEEIGAYLPTWDIDGNRRFVGWFVDLNDDGIYDAESDEEFDPATPATENITLIAVWKEIPAYVGTYYGGELYNAGYGNYGGKTLTIDDDGNITGLKTGKVTAYDPVTQKVTWTQGTFYFDAEAKIILGIYNNNDIENDYYFLGQDMPSTGKVVASYGVYAVKVGGTATGYYAQFIQAKTALGDNTNIFTYGNKIYSGVEIKDTLGKTLVIDKSQANSIAKSASVVVYKDGKVIFARAAAEGKATIGDSTSSSYMPRELDAYFGTYTCEGQDSLVLGGAGEFAWGEKSGTYTVTDADAKKFGLYVADKDGKNIEYYEVTLNGSTYTDEKPMVTVTYTTAITPKEALEASVQVNKNIEITLPTLTNADNMFRGWLIEGKETLYNGAYKPVANVDFTAKWDTKYTFTAVYNDGTTENLVKVYGAGDVVDVEKPVWAKHRFDGWFTTATFDEGTEWESGSKINASIIVYAKWSDAEPWYNTYIPVQFNGTNANGAVNTPDVRSSGKISVDADGNAKKSGWPFNAGDIAIAYTVKEAGEISVTIGSNLYYGYIDKATGVIVMSNTIKDKTFSKVYYLLPIEKVDSADVKCSYWNGGKTRVLSYSKDGTNYAAFINDGKVYFGTSFKDAAVNGNTIAAENCYNAKSLYVFGADGSEIARFAYNGTTMVKSDGTEGTYTNGDMKLVLNGAGLIDIYGLDGELSGTGTYTTSEDTSYQYDVVLSDVSYKLSIDKDTYTVTKFESNCVTITYKNGDNIVKTDDAVYRLVERDLWSGYTVEGFVFRGWYLDGDENQTLVTKYTATGNATFVAKLDPAVTLTIVYGNGLENATHTLGAGDALNMNKYVLAYIDGMAFDHWYTLGDDGTTQTEFAATTIDADITVYAAYVTAACPFVGTFKGVYLPSGTSNYDYLNLSANQTITFAADGTVSGYVSGTVQNYDATTGTFNVVDGTTVTKFISDAQNGVFAYKSGRSWYVFLTNTSELAKYSTSNSAAEICSMETAVFTVKATDADGVVTVRTVVLNKDSEGNYNIYGNATVYVNGSVVENGGTVGGLKDSVRFVDANGNTIVEYVKSSSTYSKVA